MSDRMTGIPFDRLISWVLTEYRREHSIFGVAENKFFRKAKRYKLSLYDRVLETPLGPAAGPHTQLAQNIIAAYLAGCRFFELKTVQVIDGQDLPVEKPCIWAKDEGYNVEWSTELRVPEAMKEYIKAWLALKVLSKELSLGAEDGFQFNMSVGYDLAGIKSEKIHTFMNGLMDASKTSIWMECKNFLLENLSMFSRIDAEYIESISPKISNSITLSTLHGCPSEEIEKIASYFIKDKRLHTYIKCNPTLLGYEFVRKTLDQMGYDYLVFNDHHFTKDLQFEEAVPMLTRLSALAKEQGVSFGVKLSNTLPVKIMKHELPGEEMYLSGKALYPLTIHLAYRLAKELDGNIRISYAGGADYFNIRKIYETGIWPITLATNLLKPGGYLRLKQLTEALEEGNQETAYGGVDVNKLRLLAEGAVYDVNYMKTWQKLKSRKGKEKVPLLNCFLAPCKLECPIGQDIPKYIRLVKEERYQEALEVITDANPLTFITGNLCNHGCMEGCTRLYYEEPVRIRYMKLLAARKGYRDFIHKLEKPEINSSFQVAIIGGGPAGLSGAYFLAKEGVDVTVFEKREEIGGIIQHVAPDFRISREEIKKDMDLIRQMGVKFRLGVAADFYVDTLKEEGFKYIFITTGAWKPAPLVLENCDGDIRDALVFLESYNKAPQDLHLGRTVAVIGGGNSAMDTARAAIRLKGVEQVFIIYRRTRKYMPADQEELALALQEGIELRELLSPVSFMQGVLRCQRMELGPMDTTGRRSPVPIPDEYVELQVDSIIAALGQQVETEHFERNKLKFKDKGKVWVNPETNETSVEGVFVGGDALRGPSTIVECIADGRKFAHIVLEREGKPRTGSKTVVFDEEKQLADIRLKKGMIRRPCGQRENDDRCLECNKLCNLCVEVCPNRANIEVLVPRPVDCLNLGSNSHIRGSRLRTTAKSSFPYSSQVIHMDGLCNCCGNCETFCPYDSVPYMDKFTLYWSKESFANSNNSGFLLLDRATSRFLVRLGNQVEEVAFTTSGQWEGKIPREIAFLIWSVLERYSYLMLEEAEASVE